MNLKHLKIISLLGVMFLMCGCASLSTPTISGPTAKIGVLDQQMFVNQNLIAIYLLIISPLICKFYIVPKIEKKVGRKLNYIPLINITPFATYFNQQIGISSYILNRYYAFKRRGERSLPFGGNSLSLKQVGYTIDMVSKAELIFSFLVKISLYVSLVSFLIVFIAAYLEGYA